MTQPKAVKANRRLSTRFINGIKNFGKKEHATSPKEEKPAEAVEAKPAEEATVTSTEAPVLGKPIPTEPLSIDEVSVAMPRVSSKLLTVASPFRSPAHRQPSPRLQLSPPQLRLIAR